MRPACISGGDSCLSRKKNFTVRWFCLDEVCTADRPVGGSCLPTGVDNRDAL